MSALVSQGHYTAADSLLARWAAVAPEARQPVDRRLSPTAWATGDVRPLGGVRRQLGAADTAESDRCSSSRMRRSSLALIHGQGDRGGARVPRGDGPRRSPGTPRTPYYGGRSPTETARRGPSGAQPARMLHLLDSAARAASDRVAPAVQPAIPPLASCTPRRASRSARKRLIREYEQPVGEVVRAMTQCGPRRKGWFTRARAPAEAIVGFRAQAAKSGCSVCRLYEIGQAFEGLQQPDSALATYEALATTSIPDRGPGLLAVAGLPSAGRDVRSAGRQGRRRSSTMAEVRGIVEGRGSGVAAERGGGAKADCGAGAKER